MEIYSDLRSVTSQILLRESDILLVTEARFATALKFGEITVRILRTTFNCDSCKARGRRLLQIDNSTMSWSCCHLIAKYEKAKYEKRFSERPFLCACAG